MRNAISTCKLISWFVLLPLSLFWPTLTVIICNWQNKTLSSCLLRMSDMAAGYCLGYCSDLRTEVAGNITHLSLYPRHACEVDSSSTSQAATSQIHRRHMRTRLNNCDTSPTCEDITPPETRNIAGLYCRHAGGEDWHGLCCRQLLFSYRSSVAGSTGSYVAGSSAAYENQA